MNTSNITNYKPKEFAELLNVSVKTLQRWTGRIHVFSRRLYGLRKYKKQIEGDENIAKGIQDRNSADYKTESKNHLLNWHSQIFI